MVGVGVVCVCVCPRGCVCVHFVVHACAIVGSTLSTVARARAYALAMRAPSHVWLQQPYCQGQCPGLHPCMSSCHGWNPCHGRHPCQCQGHGLHPCQSQGQGIRPCQGPGLDVVLSLPAQTSTTHSPPNAMMARAYALAMQPMAAMPAVVGLGCRPPNSSI